MVELASNVVSDNKLCFQILVAATPVKMSEIVTDKTKHIFSKSKITPHADVVFKPNKVRKKKLQNGNL